MLEKNMLHRYISTGLGKTFLLRVNHPYLPSKVKLSTNNH